jgi:hypothetical protein
VSTTETSDGTSPAHRVNSYSGLPDKLVRAANGIDYAYRDTGPTASAVHVFAHGPHSLGLAHGAGEVAIWTTLAQAWIHEQAPPPG